MTNHYEYQMINVTTEPLTSEGGRPSVAATANRWAEMGWRTVAVMLSKGPGYADCILIEREKQ